MSNVMSRRTSGPIPYRNPTFSNWISVMVSGQPSLYFGAIIADYA
tara:strand:- start:586 stop:720 length:135 start_codon:yes stop_codon:yes gene_type:complete